MTIRKSGQNKVDSLVTAIISKVTSLISTHNNDSSAHSDIRNTVNTKISKSSSAGLVRNDGSIDSTTYVTTGDSRLTNARTPTSHAHGSITNAGGVSTTTSTVKNIVVTDSNNLIKVTDKIGINNINIQEISSKNNLSDGIYIYEE